MTSADLKDWGKHPSWKERLANVAISSEKVEEHALSKEVGIKSGLDVFEGIFDNNVEISAGVTYCKESRSEPE